MPSFVALVDDPVGYDVSRPLERAARMLGRERLDSFRAAIASQAPTRRSATAARATARELTGDALVDRAALEELAALCGLGKDAKRLAHKIAEVGLLACPPSTGSTPASRLGGPALAPENGATPTARDGRPLSFIAGFDLAELPPAERGVARPARGWWLFYLDLGQQDGEPFYEQEANVEGARARLLVLPPGAAPVQARDGAPPAFPKRPVTMLPVLTLPDGWNAPNELELDPFAATAYEELEGRLRDAHEALATANGKLAGCHWVGGLATGAQGSSGDADTLLLLHLEQDEALGFEFLDAGTVQFRSHAAAFAAGNWSAATAEGDSN